MRRPSGARSGFTLVELLVVIGVLALRSGLLMPALGAVHRKGLKRREMSALKQVGIAWQLYSSNNKEQLLPGYLDTPVQQVWSVKYQYPNHELMPPYPNYGVGDNIAGPWTWRLLPSLG